MSGTATGSAAASRSFGEILRERRSRRAFLPDPASTVETVTVVQAPDAEA